MLELDIFKLPEKYRFNEENLTDLKYIDDNSLFVYYSLAKGRYSTIDPAMAFLFLKPFEWNYIDFMAFLLSASRQYGMKIKNIRANFSAIEEEYEVLMHDSFGQPDVMKLVKYQQMVADAMMKHDHSKPFKQPKWYQDTYKWILDLREKEPERDEVILFNKFYTDTATEADIERLLIYADRTVPMYKTDDELNLSKELFRKILSWTVFSVEMSDEAHDKLAKDIDNYLEAFIQDKLTRNDKDKKLGDSKVGQSKNIYTFKKHNAMFQEYLQKMLDDYGNTVTIENIFEDRFPNISYPSSEELRERFSSRNFYFCHILFAYQKLGLIDFLLLASNWDYREENELTYQAKIEILPDFTNENRDKKLYFDTDKSRFYVQGKEIKLKKFGDEYHTLRIIFDNPKDIGQEWFFSDIRDSIDAMSRDDDKKYYNAIYQIKTKLEKVGIDDFFITTAQSATINKKYLS